MGISREAVEQHYQIPSLKGRTTRFGLEEIRRLLLKLDPGKQLTTEYIARLLLGTTFTGDLDPPINVGIDLNEAKQFLELMLSDNYNDDFTISLVGFIFLGTVSSAVSGLHLVQTTAGHLGMASNSVRAGDKICCALGCTAPLLLRPLENGMFKVVGPCLIPDFTNGGVFLGPLPENIRPLHVYNEATDNYEPGFKDAFSGAITHEDPRLESLSLDPGYFDSFRERLDKNHWARIYVDPEILRERGVELKCFDLV
ncbi:cyclophilin peptidyl-prolyl cis-trans isomerase Cyp8 [Hypoxylon texense]